MFNRIEALSEILPYVRQFVGKVFVVKLGGEVCEPRYLKGIVKQLSLIHHIGIKVILVHGGGPQMDSLLERLGVPIQMVDGRRITDDATLEAAKMVYAGLLRTDIVAALYAEGVKAVGLSGIDGNLLTAERRAVQKVPNQNGDGRAIDFQNVGDITEVDLSLLRLLLEQKILPVICSLAADKAGNVLNINADTIASTIASALQAEKLIILSNVPGVLRKRGDPSSLISYTGISALQEMLRDGKISDGMSPKVTACLNALKAGVKKTHIIDGTTPSSLLLELFLNEGIGTMIVEETEDARIATELQVMNK